MTRFPITGGPGGERTPGKVTLGQLPSIPTPWTAISQTIANREVERVSLMDNLSVTERADAQSYTGSIDTTAKAQTIVDYLAGKQGGTLEIPYGKYQWNGLVAKTGVTIAYEGYRGETGRSTATLTPCQIVSTSGPWVIDTPPSSTNGINICGLSLQGPGASPSCGGIRMQNTTRGAIVGCYLTNFSEWAIFHGAGFACYFWGNVAFNSLLDRTRSIDQTTLPHGAIEVRGNDCWEMNGEYSCSMTGVFGASTVTGTAQAGGTNTIQLQAGSNSTNNFYAGYTCEITGGTGVGQINYCTSYTGATVTMTMLVNWATAPDATSTYLLTPQRCAAGAFKGTDTWLSNGIYELSELGIWIANPATEPPVHGTGLSLDQNSGFGGIITGSAAMGPGCSAQRNSKAVDGQYDDILLIGGSGTILDGVVTGALGADTNQPRHGIHDACSASNIAQVNRNVAANICRKGNRRGKTVKIESSPSNTGLACDLAPGYTGLASNSTTPSMDGWKVGRFQYTSTVSVTQILDIIDGVTYTFTANNTNVTLVNGANIKTYNGANFVMSATAVFEATALGGVLYQTAPQATVQVPIKAIVYSASMTPDASAGNWQQTTVTDGNAMTFNAPTNPPDSAHSETLGIEIFNNSGGAMGTVTWNGIYNFAGIGATWANPATGKKRFVIFQWNGAGAKWVATSIATADYI